jgi:hypothetical protein
MGCFLGILLAYASLAHNPQIYCHQEDTYKHFIGENTTPLQYLTQPNAHELRRASKDLYSASIQNLCNVTYQQTHAALILSQTCVKKLANGKKCQANTECLSEKCKQVNSTNSVCASNTQALGENCMGNSDCATNLSCHAKTNICTPQAQLNESCAHIQCSKGLLCNSALICQPLFSISDGKFSTKNYYCSSGVISSTQTCLPENETPKLQKNNRYGLCNYNQDCQYRYQNKSLAMIQGGTCKVSSLSDANNKYCRYIGTEAEQHNIISHLADLAQSEYNLDRMLEGNLSMVNPSLCSFEGADVVVNGSIMDYVVYLVIMVLATSLII